MTVPGKRNRTRFVAVLTTAVLTLAGCAKRPPPPPVMPPLRVEVGYALGNPVDPPAPAGGAAGGVSLLLRLQGYAAGASAAAPGESLAARGGLVISSANEPLATAPPTVEAVRLITDMSLLPAPAGRGAAPLVNRTAPLPAGCTTTVSFVAAGGGGRAGGDPVVTVGIIPPSAAGQDRPRLVIGAAGAPSEESSPAAAQPESGDRSLLLDWPLPTPAGEFALYFPADPRRGLRLPTVWRFQVSDVTGDAEAARASAQVLKDLSAKPPSTRTPRGQLLATALAPSGGPSDVRNALLAVSAEVRGEVSSEAALLLDDQALTASAASIAQALAAAPPEADTAYLGWVVDRALLAGLAKLAAGGEFPPAVSAMLSARFGEAGRDPGALGELAAASPSRADFETRVQAENLILLDDASPASRVRAFEWLSSRNEAPQGYNPLGSSAERRAAIDAHLQSLTRQPETNPATRPSSQPARQP
jgi:hypothetical protein